MHIIFDTTNKQHTIYFSSLIFNTFTIVVTVDIIPTFYVFVQLIYTIGTSLSKVHIVISQSNISKLFLNQ